MTNKDDQMYWVALTAFRPFGAVRLAKLMNGFGTMEQAFHADRISLERAGIEPELASRFLQERMHIDPQALFQQLEKHDIQVVTLKEAAYPPLLKEIYDPPAVLFVRGTLPDPGKKYLAVVGSRKASTYGQRVTEDLIVPIARAGVVIVSGLAYGIDASAHDATLRAQGCTLAVVGCGVDQDSIYPSHHRALASDIISSGGALISEFPPGTPPLKQHFPIRNRIIAGLCHGTLVIEATLKSGSLITARSAIENNREVYAVPGSIYSPLSEGPNNLIKTGAIPVTSAQDVFGIQDVSSTPSQPAYQPTNEKEAAIFSHLFSQPIHLDELVRSTGLPTPLVMSTLTLMEIKGVVRHEGGYFYTRIN